MYYIYIFFFFLFPKYAEAVVAGHRSWLRTQTDPFITTDSCRSQEPFLCSDTCISNAEILALLQGETRWTKPFFSFFQVNRVTKKRESGLFWALFFPPLHKNRSIWSLYYLGDVLSQTAAASQCQNVSNSENSEDKIFHTQHTKFWASPVFGGPLETKYRGFYLTGRKVLIVSPCMPVFVKDIHNSY